MDSHVYQRAECFLPWNLQHSVFNSTIFPYWTAEALYYFQETATGKSLLRIDIKSGNTEKIFEYQQLLNLLSTQLKQEIDPIQLPLDIFSMDESPRRLHFSYQKNNWYYDFEKNTCIQEDNSPEYLKSPDKNWALSIKEHNLVLNDLVSHQDFQLTKDGERYLDYATSPETNTRTIRLKFENTITPPVALWSADSHKIVTHKLDQRNVDFLFLLQNSPEGSQRPELHNYRMSFSGDANLPMAELLIIDTLTQKITPIKSDSMLSPYLTPLEFKWVWWSDDNQKIYFLRDTRSSKQLMLCVADAHSGVTETLITETADTYIEPSQHFLWPHQVIALEDSKEIIWLSERSGNAHLYLYDMGSNVAKKAITQGEWNVREVHFYDAKTNWLYFTATGYNKDIDPYYKQLFRCHLDGSEIQCLTEENASHSIYISPDKHCFLDTYSTIDTAPVSHLKTMDGKLISHLETADISGLAKLKWVPPKRICLKARDGITPIYGNLYFPSHFDPDKKYPLIDHIYPGPQVYRTSEHFTLYGSIFRSQWTAQAIAELGFIVLHIDGFGTPGRSKAFHDMTYKNMSDCGIPDHVTAIKQLAELYSFIELNKVGITGYSGGAFAAARAMLMYPEFFKVGVAAAGNHDLRCYPASYGEKYNSMDTTTYETQSNAAHAANLEGKLLLIHGEMDDNVHPCATMQFVDALIKHNKDF
ncbi:MAG: DPP IV N-terminal domain-containing protein, partial [Gammaproteobacteria bacterium]